MKEMLEILEAMGYDGEKPPQKLLNTIETFRKRKCAMRPEELTVGDIAFCTMLYELAHAKETAKRNV